MSNAGSPPSPFPSSLVTDPAKEAVQELSVNLLKTLNQILLNESAVSRITRLVRGLSIIDLDVSY